MTQVLLIDDDRDFRAAACAMLEAAGFEVLEVMAADAAEAARCLTADVVLCDLFMPDKDGLEVIRQFRRDLPDIPVIAMSGGGFKGKLDLLTLARQLGASGALHKPFTSAQVVAAINEVVAGSRQVVP